MAVRNGSVELWESLRTMASECATSHEIISKACLCDSVFTKDIELSFLAESSKCNYGSQISDKFFSFPKHTIRM